MDKLSEIKQSLAKTEEKLKQAKAEMDEKDEYYAMFEYLYQMNSATREYLYELEYSLSQHASPSNGHLPKIKGAGKMESALKTLGLSEDYNVEKPTIHVRASRAGNPEFTVELKAPKR